MTNRATLWFPRRFGHSGTDRLCINFVNVCQGEAAHGSHWKACGCHGSKQETVRKF